MAREIPGFFYDEEKGKYFRIQPNHRVVAGTGYTKQSVKAIRQTKEAEIRMQKQGKRRKDGTIVRSKTLLSAISLSARLGQSLSQNRANFTQEYALNLSSRPLTSPEYHPISGSVFNITNSGVLRFHSPVVQMTDPEIMACTSTYIEGLSSFQDLAFGHPSGPTYNGVHLAEPGYHTLGSIHDAGREVAVVCTDAGRRMVYTSVDEGGLLGDPFHYNLYPASQETEAIWDLATSSEKPCMALATRTGLLTFDCQNKHHVQIKIALDKEQMNVHFKDPHTIMSGERSGQINFTDTRSNSSVVRLLHSSAVLGTVALRDGNQIIAHGYSTTSSYDLRWTQASVSKRARSTDRKKHSKAYLQFAVPRERHTDHYTIGRKLAYSSDLELLAAINSNSAPKSGADPLSLGQNHITLYSTRTGKVLDSPLTRRNYGQAIKSVDMRRVRDGAESIICLAGERLEEWSCGRLETEDENYGVLPLNTQLEKRELSVEQEWERTRLRLLDLT